MGRRVATNNPVSNHARGWIVRGGRVQCSHPSCRSMLEQAFTIDAWKKHAGHPSGDPVLLCDLMMDLGTYVNFGADRVKGKSPPRFEHVLTCVYCQQLKAEPLVACTWCVCAFHASCLAVNARQQLPDGCKHVTCGSCARGLSKEAKLSAAQRATPMPGYAYPQHEWLQVQQPTREQAVPQQPMPVQVAMNLPVRLQAAGSAASAPEGGAVAAPPPVRVPRSYPAALAAAAAAVSCATGAAPAFEGTGPAALQLPPAHEGFCADDFVAVVDVCRAFGQAVEWELLGLDVDEGMRIMAAVGRDVRAGGLQLVALVALTYRQLRKNCGQGDHGSAKALLMSLGP